MKRLYAGDIVRWGEKEGRVVRVICKKGLTADQDTPRNIFEKNFDRHDYRRMFKTQKSIAKLKHKYTYLVATSKTRLDRKTPVYMPDPNLLELVE